MNPNEMKRQSEVIDMMVTMHSVLSNRYGLRARILEISLFAGSALLVALTFVDPLVLRSLSAEPWSVRIAAGVASIAIFIVSIVSILVDWRGEAAQHREAFTSLAQLKSEWKQQITSYDQIAAVERASFIQRSALLVANLVPVPDSSFNSLKAKHYRKVGISRLISENPGVSLAALRFRLCWDGVKLGWRLRIERGADE